jgi:hypothetical protein
VPLEPLTASETARAIGTDTTLIVSRADRGYRVATFCRHAFLQMLTPV